MEGAKQAKLPPLRDTLTAMGFSFVDNPALRGYPESRLWRRDVVIEVMYDYNLERVTLTVHGPFSDFLAAEKYRRVRPYGCADELLPYVVKAIADFP